MVKWPGKKPKDKPKGSGSGSSDRDWTYCRTCHGTGTLGYDKKTKRYIPCGTCGGSGR